MKTMEGQEPDPHRLLEESRQHIAALERAYAEAEQRAQKHLGERDHWHGQHWEAHQENRRLQQAYQSLRVQKGGFGFTMLLTVAAVAALFGLAAGYVFIRLSNDHSKAFQRFRGDQQFQLEFALSQGKFEESSAILQQAARHADLVDVVGAG
ncbi:MAG TPA: hypothetical protein PK971_12630, partial [Saprospiraceae bacterium]|nr:hypothetical protein [Saprospiraceae bacterium]